MRRSSRADRKYVRCTFPSASERHGGQVWNPPLPVRCVGADRIADCALQCQKTYLCSNVLSALRRRRGGGGVREKERQGYAKAPRFSVLGSQLSVLSSWFSVLTPHAAPAPATFAPCAMPGTAPPAAQQQRLLPLPAPTARRSTRRAASNRTSGG